MKLVEELPKCVPVSYEYQDSVLEVESTVCEAMKVGGPYPKFFFRGPCTKLSSTLVASFPLHFEPFVAGCRRLS